MNFVTEALNNKETVIAIFCNLRKAFDTVNHSILLRKLLKIGIQGVALEWFKNYLSGRKQFVSLKALTNEKRGGPTMVSFDRFGFKLFSL